MNDYGRTRIRYVVFIAAVLLGVLFLIDYVTRQINRPPEKEPITDSVITVEYPRLYEAVYRRSTEDIRPFLDHESKVVREQAWRALTQTQIDSLAWFVRKAGESNMDEAWAALSQHAFTGNLLRHLEQLWLEEEEQRGGISRVLGRQGDEQTLKFLLDNQDRKAGRSYEYDYALAVGRLMTQFGLGSDEQLNVIRRAFEVTNPAVSRAYLYGFYRGSAQKLNTAIRDTLYQQWSLYGLGNSPVVDQYMIKIIKQRVFYEVTLYYNSEDRLDQQVQLGVELARALDELELTPNTALAAKILLMHRNPLVVQQALASLEGKLTEDDHLFSYTRQDILKNDQTEAPVWLQALETVAEVDPAVIGEHRQRLDQIQKEQLYMLPQVFAVRQIDETPEGFIDMIEANIQEDTPLRTQFAIQALTDYWADIPDEDKSPELTDRVREFVFEALSHHDRGVAYTAQSLLKREELFGPQDFNRINDVLTSFQLPEDIEVYQAFGAVYKEQFEGQAVAVIDSLAALEYAPLNRSLSQAGWDVPVPEDRQQTFRVPAWEQLWQLGYDPVWVLETEKGTIRVQMNILKTPATVSAIDSLTRAGAYNGVPFHRVVPNFVIQGGDIERQDGFGGPDFILPTEASEEEYVQGAAGIASAGPDTEGSQYFFMHQWSPHLNGRYTLFGHVIEGQDVVNRIVVGDRVERAYWE